MQGYQAWEVILKLPEPDLGIAFEIAKNFGLDMEIMTEFLPVCMQAIKDAISSEKN